MDNRPIGIFDSGVGGLSAMRRLIQEAPAESFVYFGDTIRAPYGDRTAEEIKFLSRRNARFIRSLGVKALIIACNTSTANAMAELARDNADIPISGTIEPAAEEAARRTAGGKIGVIATAATIRSGVYEKALREKLPGREVISRSCPRLVPLIEAGHISPEDPALMAALEEYLAPLRRAGVDTLILGCTHYPLISEAVGRAMGREIAMVDSGGACAQAVIEKLRAENALAEKGFPRQERFYCSGRRGEFTAVAEKFLGRSIESLTQEIEVEGY